MTMSEAPQSAGFYHGEVVIDPFEQLEMFEGFKVHGRSYVTDVIIFSTSYASQGGGLCVSLQCI